MFTINIYLKFAIIAASFIIGTALWMAYGFGYAWIFYLIGILFLISYLLLGTVQTTAQLIQDEDFEGAEKRLNLTVSPKLLYVTNRAFYYIMKGTLASQKKDNVAAQEYFDKALNMDLPSDNERAMVLLQLANMNATQNKWTAAKKYFKEAKKLKVTEPQLKMQISQFDKAFANRGQMKAAGMGRGGVQMAGGKRRRPKMR